MNWLTHEIPGTGGVYKETPQDFQVEEIPLYACSGEGEHLYLWVEKVGISTRELLGQLARSLNLKERDIGYAGLKDARALTRQMVSVPFDKFEQNKIRNNENFKIIDFKRHTNKLRLGHLAGNKFTIRLNKTHPDAPERAEAILNRLQQRGVPNLFGEQRYGILGNSAQLGHFLLQRRFEDFCRELIGDPAMIRNPAWNKAATSYRENNLREAYNLLPRRMRDERRLLNQLLKGQSHQDAALSLPRNLLRLFLSAAQSAMFDQLLMQRLPHLNQLYDGDIAVKHSNGACFRVEKAEKEQFRVTDFEISPSAPLFGTKVMIATGWAGEQEAALLNAEELTLKSWKFGQGLTMPGERRALRVPISNTKIVSCENESITLNFTLPKGSYATSVLREIIK